MAEVVERDERIQALQAQLRDLVAVLSLPVMWRGRTPAEIAAELADLLLHLLRLDVSYVRLDHGAGGPVVEELRPADIGPREQVTERIHHFLDSDRPPDPLELADGETVRLARVEPGVDSERWFVVVGSARPDFPTDAEGFLMRSAIDQAAVAVENARLYEEARQASRAKSEFLAVMSHELRTPLNAILGYVDLLLQGIPAQLPDASARQVERIRLSARHLLHLIDDVLHFAQLQAGREEIEPEPMELASLVREAADLIEPLARAKGLEFRVHVPDRRVAVELDRNKVRQILLNLLSNAVKYTEEGEIELGAEARDERIFLRVRDTGVGIPAAKLERIFDPFGQLDQALTRREGGSGLGLSVSRELARLMGGDLTVESEVAKGSTFTVELPARIQVTA